MFSDMFVPLIQAKLRCSRLQNKVRYRNGFHDDAFFTAQGAVTAV
jgi:hypothetical protein